MALSKPYQTAGPPWLDSERYELHVSGMSDGHKLQPGSDSPEIAGVARDNGLLRPPRTNDDVGINYVSCSGLRQ